MAQSEVRRMIRWLKKYGLSDSEILDLIEYMEGGKKLPKPKNEK